MGKNTGKNISKNVSGKYRQKLLRNAKESAIDVFETSSVIQKTAEATGNLIGNTIANKIMKVSRSSVQNNSEAITNEYDKEIPKERYIAPEERHKISDDLRSI